MSEDGRRSAVTKPAVRSPAATLPGLAGAPPSPAPSAPTRAVASTLLGHAATMPATPGRPAVAMPSTPPAPTQGDTVEVGRFDAQSPSSERRRRTIALAVGSAAAVAVVLVVGLTHSRHASPPGAASTTRAAAPKPAPPTVVVAPLEAPAAPEEIAPAPSPAPTAEKMPRMRHRPLAHREREAAPQKRRPPAHKRALAMKEKPMGDRAGARAAYQRGNDLLLTGNAGGAIDAYQEAVRLAPSDPVGYRGLGLAYEKEGKNKEAIAALVSYLKLSRHAHDREVIARRLYRLTHTD
jgi:tetratricopeptide repeat protein